MMLSRLPVDRLAGASHPRLDHALASSGRRDDAGRCPLKRRRLGSCAPGVLALTMALVTSCCLVSSARAEAGRFHDGVAYDPSSVDLHVVDADDRGDGHWIVLGSHIDIANRETPYLGLRTHGGRRVAAVALDPPAGTSWSPRGLVVLESAAVLVAGIQSDPQDFEAPQAIFVVRLDDTLSPTWSRILSVEGASITNAAFRPVDDGTVAIAGGVQRIVDGTVEPADALLARIDGSTGDVVDAHAIGTPAYDERGADIAFAATGSALLLEVSREAGAGRAFADGIVGFDAAGTFAAAHVAGHAIASPIRASAQRILPDSRGWVITGRRTVFGPNVFYMQRVSPAFVPMPARTLIPFFNVADVAADDSDGLLLFGEANSEASDRGTALIRVDAQLGIRSQHRFGTRNLDFPTGAIAAGDHGRLIVVGGTREDDGLRFESVDRIDAATDASLLCDDESYDGFSAVVDGIDSWPAWEPAVAPIGMLSIAASMTTRALDAEPVADCAHADDRVFRDGLD